MARSPLNFFMSMGALCCPWAMATRVPIQSAQKTLCILSPTIFALHEIWSQLEVYTSLKKWTDNDNRPSKYSLTYLTSAYNSGELKQCDQKLGLRLK